MTALLEHPPASTVESVSDDWERIVAALTRRELVERGLAVGAVALLGGDLAAAASAADGQRTIATTQGPVRIPVQPKRVVTVDWYSLPILLDLGYRPVGVPTQLAEGLLPRYGALYGRLPKVGSVDQPRLERIAALHPDLIIGLDQFNAGLYGKLSGIAPTALFRWKSSGDWAALAHSVSDAVGRLGREKSLEASYRARTAAFRKKHAQVLARTKWGIATGGAYNGKAVAYVWHANSDTGSILAAAGVHFAKASAGSVPGGVTGISFEQLDRLQDADVIVVEGTESGAVAPYSKPLVTQPTFKRLPAAKAGHVYPLAQFFPTSYGQAIALLDGLERVLARLAHS